MLFSNIKIGNMLLKNRVVRSATNEGMADTFGKPDVERLTKLYLELVKGGVGLIMTGHAFVNYFGKANDGMLGIHKDNLIPLYKKITESVNKSGGRIIMQINHSGRQKVTSDNKDTIAPSVVRCKKTGNIPKEMSEDEIEKTISDFADAALRVKKAGFHGVEIHSAHGYLISEFNSPYTNKRTDKWGGNVENRGRFFVEVIKKVREKTGDDFPIFAKLNCDDCVLGGIEITESLIIGKMAEKAGLSAVEISGGIFESRFGAARTKIDSPDKEGYFLDAAKKFKKNLSIPVIAVGGFRSRKVAEDALKNNIADLISFSRPFIREPDLLQKFLKGKEKADCISCNKCFGGITTGLRCQELTSS